MEKKTSLDGNALFEYFMLPFLFIWSVFGAVNLYGLYVGNSPEITVGHVSRVIGLTKSSVFLSVIDERGRSQFYTACRRVNLVKGSLVEVGASEYYRSIVFGFKKAMYLKSDDNVLCGSKGNLITPRVGGGVYRLLLLLYFLFAWLWFLEDLKIRGIGNVV